MPKTPDEIKKGLEHCINGSSCRGCPFCEECATASDCNPMQKDLQGYIQQLEAQVPRWIPVEERLPEHGKNVLVHVANRVGMWHTEIDWLKDNGKWENNADCEWHHITHWMTLPEPPKEE